MERELQKLIEEGKPWREIKRKGREALSPDARKDFDELREICMNEGLFIAPAGELESMLTDYGIPSTTENKSWIVQALKLLSGLQSDATKQPWRLIQDVHQFLTH